MSRPVNTKLLIPEGKQEVRPIKAALLAWSVTGMTIQQIVEKTPDTMTLPEYGAYMLVMNVYEAKPGSRERQRALEALRMVTDGLEPGQVGPAIPVTLIDRLIQGEDGFVQRTKEIQQEVKVQLTLPGESDGGQREDG